MNIPPPSLRSKNKPRKLYVSPKRRLTFNGLDGAIFLNIVLFIITAVRAWNRSQNQSCVTTDGQSILMSSTHMGPKTRFLLLSDSCQLFDMGLSLSFWREDGSAVYNCCWSSPVQSFSGPSPGGLMTTFYCLRFETPQTWRARFPYL
jgi:hypothetical protein